MLNRIFCRWLIGDESGSLVWGSGHDSSRSYDVYIDGQLLVVGVGNEYNLIEQATDRRAF